MLFMIGVFDAIGNVIEIAENGILLTIVSTLIYMMTGGWKYVFRKISFFFDTQLVKLIGAVYEYFNLLLQGELFKETIVNELINNVYVFIGVIMFFRIMMVIMKYLVNPDLISDGKIGAHALMQRVILGCCGILFIPGIFNLMIGFQQAILQDNVVQQIIIPSDMLDEVSMKVNQGGHHIGTYVLAGFLNPSKYAKNSDIKEFELGIERGDLSNIDVSESFLTVNFKYDYFFFISTLVLAYVFYLMLKYCIDIVVRFFKMLLYRILTPVAMIEYMINGSGDGIFKNWLSAILGTYFMLFVRILAIWFVVFVMALMDPSSSFQAKYAGNLLLNDDYFLRAIIIIGLLGFMMDLPKLVGQIFGLDLEQESSATGILKQVGGMLKSAATGALAVGGAAAAGGYGMAKSGLKSASKLGDKGLSALKNSSFGQNMAKKMGENKLGSMALKGAQGMSNFSKGLAEKTGIAKDAVKKVKDSEFGSSLTATSKGVLGAVMNSNEFTRSAYSSASGVNDSIDRDDKSRKASEKEAAKERQEAQERSEDVIRNVSERVVETMPKGTDAKTIKANVEAQMFGQPDTVTANVMGRLAGVGKTEGNIDVGSVTQTVKQTLGERFDVAPGEVEQVVKQVVKNPENVTEAEINQVVNQVIGNRVAAQEETITQVVNQVVGTRVNNSVDDATQTVNQTLNRIAHNTEEMNVYAEISTEHIEKMRQDIEQQVDIQRNIETNTRNNPIDPKK